MFARPGLPSFEYVQATEPDHVAQLLTQHGDTVRLFMGGTDLFPRMRDGFVRPRLVVDVKHVPGLDELRYNQDTGLHVGAAVTLNQLANHRPVQTHYAVLAEAAASVASYQLRNRATLGGNLCNASPAADTAPAALVLDARVVVYGEQGPRDVPSDQFFLGRGQTAMQASEFMIAVRFPVPPPSAAGRYLKLGRNKRGDLSIVGVAVLGFPDGTAAAGYRFRIALASVAPIPLRVQDAETVLAAHPPGEEAFALAAEKAMQAATPIDDVRGSAAYRKAMVRNLTRRALGQVWRQLRNR